MGTSLDDEYVGKPLDQLETHLLQLINSDGFD